MRVADEFVGQLADVHQPVLMHTNIHERAEGRDIGHSPFQHHAGAQVGYGLHAIGKGRSAEFGARVAARLFKFRQNIAHCGQAEAVIDEICGRKRAQDRRSRHQRAQVLAGGLHDPAGQIIGFGVHGGGIERFGGIADAQEPCRLFKGFRPKAGDFQQILARLERACGIAMRHNRLGQGLRQARHPREQSARGRVQLYPDRVHCIFDHGIERAGQPRLVHIVLILADPDAFRLDLDQLGQRVLQAARNRHGPAQADIQIRKLG